jgi:hypothetical protein
MSLLPMPDPPRSWTLTHVRVYVIVIKRSVANWKVIVGRVHGGQYKHILAWLFRRGRTRNSNLQRQMYTVA